MIIYKGWYYFRKGKGSIYKIEMEAQGSLVSNSYLEEWDIWVNEEDSLEEQVKSVLHELCHLGIEHDILKRESLKEKSKANEEECNGTSAILKIIDRETEKFYTRNPPLVEKIREILQPEEKQEPREIESPGQLKLFELT